MSVPLIVVIAAAAVALLLGWVLGRRRKEEPDPYQAPLGGLAQALRDGRVGEPVAGEPAGIGAVRDAVAAGWTARNAEREEVLKQALGRIAAFAGESVEGPLKRVRDGDRDLMREGIDRALGGLQDLHFFLIESIVPDETHDIVPLVKTVAHEFMVDSEIPVRLQLSSMPVRAHIHRETFLDAVYLLLRNAGDFGGGKRVDVRVEAGAGSAVVSILDQGPGFTPEALERGRDLFYTTKPAGLGLGIPFARKIIEGFGGNLELANRPEGGAVVRLSLPGA